MLNYFVGGPLDGKPTAKRTKFTDPLGATINATRARAILKGVWPKGMSGLYAFQKDDSYRWVQKPAKISDSTNIDITIHRLPSVVYAVWFENLSILKVGKSTSPYFDGPIKSAQNFLKKKGYDLTELSSGEIVWTRPGDLRDEQFIHAYLAYLFDPPFNSNGTRHSEYYDVPGFCKDELVTKIENIWDTRPITASGIMVSQPAG